MGGRPPTGAEVYELDNELPTDAYRVELGGSPNSVAWPDICPNCGRPATERIRIRKNFRRWQGSVNIEVGSSGWKYVIRSAEVPFCSGCAERHRALAPALTPAQVLVSFLGTAFMFAFVPATIATLATLPPVLTKLGEPQYWVYVAVFAVFATAAVAAALAAWRDTRFSRVPPLTEIVRACDFSDNLSDFLSGERHVYAIRNRQFAEAFTTANASRLVGDAQRARVQRVHRLKMTVGGLLLLACALGTLWLWLNGEL